jgi:hypothetical protein
VTLADRVLRILRTTSQPLDDDQLAARASVIRQAVNQTCRRLEANGVLRRYVGVDGKIVNEIVSAAGDAGASSDEQLAPTGRHTSTTSPRTTTVAPEAGAMLTEDQVKAAVRDYFAAQGFHVEVRWGRDRGIDLVATRPDERWVVEAKGEVASAQQQGNYFLGAIGELVQRMDDAGARYALALPDNPRYRGLVRRLPVLARQRLSLTVLLVARDGTVTVA